MTCLIKWILRLAGAAIAVYVVAVFFMRDIIGFIIMAKRYPFFDPAEPKIFILTDYIFIMALFVWLGHYLATGLRCRKN